MPHTPSVLPRAAPGSSRSARRSTPTACPSRARAATASASRPAGDPPGRDEVVDWLRKRVEEGSAVVRSPLAGTEKRQQGRRELVIKPEAVEAALAADPEFRDLLVVAWGDGGRPHELFAAEASFLDEAGSRWIFPIRKGKGRRIRASFISPSGRWR